MTETEDQKVVRLLKQMGLKTKNQLDLLVLGYEGAIRFEGYSPQLGFSAYLESIIATETAINKMYETK